jgi:hypothetical protein
VSQRLRERTAELEQLQRDLVLLEATPAPGRRVDKIEPETAVEVMREVIGTAEGKKKRAFLGALLEKVVLDVDTAVVDYRTEALLNAGATTSVHSVNRWLLDLGSNQGPTD